MDTSYNTFLFIDFSFGTDMPFTGWLSFRLNALRHSGKEGKPPLSSSYPPSTTAKRGLKDEMMTIWLLGEVWSSTLSSSSPSTSRQARGKRYSQFGEKGHSSLSSSYPLCTTQKVGINDNLTPTVGGGVRDTHIRGREVRC